MAPPEPTRRLISINLPDPLGTPRSGNPASKYWRPSCATVDKVWTVLIWYHFCGTIDMGFRDAKAALVAALETGRYAHEPREVQAEKNLLAIGEVSDVFVISLLRRTKGNEYSSGPHHADATVEVHVFKPSRDGIRWYVKAYFAPEMSAVFISVHRA